MKRINRHHNNNKDLKRKLAVAGIRRHLKSKSCQRSLMNKIILKLRGWDVSLIVCKPFRRWQKLEVHSVYLKKAIHINSLQSARFSLKTLSSLVLARVSSSRIISLSINLRRSEGIRCMLFPVKFNVLWLLSQLNPIDKRSILTGHRCWISNVSHMAREWSLVRVQALRAAESMRSWCDWYSNKSPISQVVASMLSS